jgi:hypothetical protein
MLPCWACTLDVMPVPSTTSETKIFAAEILEKFI